MSEFAKISDRIMPLATPSNDEIRRWQALPRDRQINRLQEVLAEAKASGVTEMTMDEIKTAAKARLAKLYWK